MPFIFGNIIDRFQLAEWVVTIIVSAQFSFVAIGSLGMGSFLPRVNFRIISFIAILSMAVGNLISMLSPNPIWLVIGRCFTGLGEGMCLGIAHGLACYTKNPDRTFSVMMFIEVIFAALIILLVPTAIKQLGIEGYLFSDDGYFRHHCTIYSISARFNHGCFRIENRLSVSMVQ